MRPNAGNTTSGKKAYNRKELSIKGVCEERR
jgi:hypothetical protein